MQFQELSEAMRALPVPVGQTTVIAALASGRLACVRWSIEHERDGQQSTYPVPRQEDVHAALQRAREAQDAGCSDWEWWGWEGEVTFRECQTALLHAARLMQGMVPLVPLPEVDGRVVMDAYAVLKQWAREVLAAAERQARVEAPPAG